jgi:hypothetical protein
MLTTKNWMRLAAFVFNLRHRFSWNADIYIIALASSPALRKRNNVSSADQIKLTEQRFTANSVTWNTIWGISRNQCRLLLPISKAVIVVNNMEYDWSTLYDLGIILCYKQFCSLSLASFWMLLPKIKFFLFLIGCFLLQVVQSYG